MHSVLLKEAMALRERRAGGGAQAAARVRTDLKLIVRKRTVQDLKHIFYYYLYDTFLNTTVLDMKWCQPCAARALARAPRIGPRFVGMDRTWP